MFVVPKNHLIVNESLKTKLWAKPWSQAAIKVIYERNLGPIDILLRTSCALVKIEVDEYTENISKLLEKLDSFHKKVILVKKLNSHKV